jgi:hypothetical protein
LQKCYCDMMQTALIELRQIPAFRGSTFTVSWLMGSDELAALPAAADGEISVSPYRTFDIFRDDDLSVVLSEMFAAYHTSLFGAPEQPGVVLPQWVTRQHKLLHHLWSNMFKSFIRGFDSSDLCKASGRDAAECPAATAATRPVPLAPYVRRAEELLRDPALEIVFFVPDDVGIGNVLKGYLTFLSLRNDAKIEINTGTMLGDYRSVLDERHIYRARATDVPEEDQQDHAEPEPVFTYRLLLLRSEEELVRSDVRYAALLPSAEDAATLNFPDNVRLMPLFAPRASIDNVFRRDALPGPVVHRILTAIRRVNFATQISALAYAATDCLVHPSLGVSVRSWRGAHEVNAGQGTRDNFDAEQREKYSQEKYENLITSVVVQKEVKSLLITFDSPSLLPDYAPFLERVRQQHGLEIVLHFLDNDAFLSLDLLQQAAVQLLALSKTSYLIGDDRSTFLEAVFWFGECRQTVFHPYI